MSSLANFPVTTPFTDVLTQVVVSTCTVEVTNLFVTPGKSVTFVYSVYLPDSSIPVFSNRVATYNLTNSALPLAGLDLSTLVVAGINLLSGTLTGTYKPDSN